MLTASAQVWAAEIEQLSTMYPGAFLPPLPEY
jgi:hypothetical protein